MITLNNLEAITQKAFNEYVMDAPQLLNSIIKQLNKPSNSLDEMVKEEFQYKFNTLFVQAILDGVELAFPENIKKFPSIWLLSWDKYFEDNYKNFKKPVRNFSFTEIKKESDKLLSLINVAVTKQNIESIQEKILDSVPYDNKSPLRYKVALKNTIFLFTKFELLSNYEDVEQDLSQIINCYYSSFDSKDNNIFKTYFYGKVDMDKISTEKVQFFKPKNQSESDFLQELFKNREAFTKAFSKSAGFSDAKEAPRMEDLFLKMMITHNHYKLEEKLPIKDNQTKIKSKKI